jgi:solute carrier family 35 protein E1
MSLSTNSISFAHVIKAMEPLFSAVASWLVLGHVMNIRVYLSLLPVVFGVIMACAGAQEFSWISFWSGMGSNAFFAMRGVVSKTVMEKSVSQRARANNDTDGDQKEKGHLNSSHMSPANLFAAVTCISFLLSLPLTIITEGSILVMLAKQSAEKETLDVSRTLAYIVSSGAFHYINNEVMYVTLSKVHPITLAVGNTAKRVFIIVAGIIVFSTPTTFQTALGSTIGIGGVFVYSLMKQWYDNGGEHSNVTKTTGEDPSETETEMTLLTNTRRVE